MLSLLKKLDIKDSNDFHKLTTSSIYEAGGRSLLVHYGDSPFKLATTVLPEYNLKPWQLTRVKGQFWKDQQYLKDFLLYIKKEENLKTDDDWYSVIVILLILLYFSSFMIIY